MITSLIPIFAQVAQAEPPTPGMMMKQFLPLIIIVAIFYIALIRPQQRKEKERKAMIAALRVGQRVLMTSGLIGKIVEVKNATFIIEIATGVNVEVARGAVTRVLVADEVPVLE